MTRLQRKLTNVLSEYIIVVTERSLASSVVVVVVVPEGLTHEILWFMISTESQFSVCRSY